MLIGLTFSTGDILQHEKTRYRDKNDQSNTYIVHRNKAKKWLGGIWYLVQDSKELQVIILFKTRNGIAVNIKKGGTRSIEPCRGSRESTLDSLCCCNS
jgi:hypothetical protein